MKNILHLFKRDVQNVSRSVNRLGCRDGPHYRTVSVRVV